MGQGLVEIGVFGRPHGIRGEASLRRFSTEITPLPYARILVGSRAMTITAQRRNGDRWLLTLEGVETREAAAALAGQVAQVPRGDLPEAPVGTAYACDLTGLSVVAEGRGKVGTVRDIVSIAGGDYLEIEGGQLIPLRPELITLVDVAAGELRMRLPEGLLDL